MTNLLDTDVLSQSTKQKANPLVEGWLARTERTENYISVVTLYELQEGIELLPEGQRKSKLSRWVEWIEEVDYAGRILAVTAEIARESARMLVAAKKQGHTAYMSDALIAGTARVHGLRMATLNVKDFRRLGVEIVEL